MERIAAPLLICLAEHETEISGAFVMEKARKAPRAEVKVYPVGHFR